MQMTFLPDPDIPPHARHGRVPINPTAPPEAVPRLSRQAEAILARLRKGPATNRELAEIALKYTGRISDLRAAGHKIHCREDRRSGVSVYTLDA